MPAGDEWAGLERDRALLDRTSTAERVAGILRDRITKGEFLPGTRLSEEGITAGLKISRNTLREAFRLLSHEKLLVHQLNRGVFVRIPDVGDLSDLYRVRRVIELAALNGIAELPPAVEERLRTAVADAERAAEEGRWPDVGAANVRFHQAIVSLSGSPRMDEVMSRLWAEMCLAWNVMANPRAIYEPYVPRNREILDLLTGGDMAAAAKLLDAYLTDAEEQLVGAYAEASGR